MWNVVNLVHALSRSNVIFARRRPTCLLCSRLKTESSIGRPPKPRLRSQIHGIGTAGYLLLIIPVTTFALGTWQVRRRQWKLDMIEKLHQTVLVPPVNFPDNLDELDELEYRRVRVRGSFDHKRELYVMPRSLMEEDRRGGSLISTQGKIGCHVITAFKLADQDLTIMVNRGWVPRQLTSPDKRTQGQIEGQVELVGVVRKTENRASFGAKNNPNMNQWCHRDIDAMSAKLNTAPIFIDAVSDSTVPGGPIGGQTRLSLRNEHASYIVTWYSLSVLTALGWYRRFLK